MRLFEWFEEICVNGKFCEILERFCIPWSDWVPDVTCDPMPFCHKMEVS